MDIRAMIRNLAAKVCMASVCLSALPSCDRWFYEEEGDCSVYYRLKFRYDKNLKWADAFANEVSSVHLYAFDKSGVLVWQREEQIDPTTAENYSMSLDLPAGDYRLLAWCGLRNDGEREESFSVPEARVGETRMKQLQCALNRKYDESGAYSKERLYRLFHGTLDVSLPSNDDGGSYDYTMCLTKNTNHVRVILHHLSGEDVAVIQVKGAIADLTVGRMMETHREKMFLTIAGKEDGETVARIPVIDYALLAKDYYEEEYNRSMTDQEFLDREDDYVMTFFLDEDNQWINSYILIHSWRVVPSNIEIE